LSHSAGCRNAVFCIWVFDFSLDDLAAVALA
jgi:hypothetical protein